MHVQTFENLLISKIQSFSVSFHIKNSILCLVYLQQFHNLLFHLTTSYPDLHKYCNFIKALSYNIFISCNKFPLQQTNLNNKLNIVDQLWDDQWQRNEREREKNLFCSHTIHLTSSITKNSLFGIICIRCLFI